MRVALVLGAVTALAASATAIAGHARSAAPAWGPAVTRWHFPLQGPNRMELADRLVGIGDYPDDTKRVTFVGINGSTQTTHASKWITVDVRKVGIPASAKVVRLSLKGTITKGESAGLATVYVLVRPFGSTCCEGPPGNEDYPVDLQIAGGFQVVSVLQTVVQLAGDGRREWTTADIALRSGKFQFAWGYRRNEGAFPTGDAIAFVMFANAYGR